MIAYLTGYWGLSFIWRIRGSVFPKALVWASASAALTVLCNLLIQSERGRANTPDWLMNSNGGVAPISLAYGIFASVLSFLVVFRNQEAYKIWIEAGVLLKTVRGSWFNAYSSLIAFRTRDESRCQDVKQFNNFLLRLMSLLYCTALQQVLPDEKDNLEIIDLHGVDREHIDFLSECDDRCEVIHQWVQRLIVKAADEGVVKMDPPILGRVYNDLAAGMVNLAKARRISEFRFPFPYAQTLTTLLLLVTFLQPVIAATFIVSPVWAGILVFIGIFTLWSINYVAHEIERPYGDGCNDLPLVEMQESFNASLTSLLEKEAMQPPLFNFDRAKNQTVPVSDGMVVPAEDEKLPVLRNNTRHGTAAPAAGGRRLDSLPSRRDSMAMRAPGTLKTRRSMKLATTASTRASTAQTSSDDLEAGGHHDASVGGAPEHATTKPPGLIRKVPRSFPEGAPVEASATERSAS